NAKFTPDKNEEGNTTRQRWRIGEPAVTVDFLIEPEKSTEAEAGRIFDLTKDWAAIIAPGLHLAFKNNRKVTLSGKTIVGETAAREICVCGAGAFVVLKALAFHIRGENKDAYDCFICCGTMARVWRTWRRSYARCYRMRVRRRRWNICAAI